MQAWEQVGLRTRKCVRAMQSDREGSTDRATGRAVQTRVPGTERAGFRHSRKCRRCMSDP